MGFFSVPRPRQQRLFPELTEREEEILSLVARGKSNQEIARQLFVSLKTVRNHVSNILLKLQVADRGTSSHPRQGIRSGARWRVAYNCL
jgi:DNA-binding NarL/FixJ family response regulator